MSDRRKGIRASLAEKYPALAAQWHPTLNGKLKPSDISKYYFEPVFWMLPYDDPITGKHFDFEWKSSPCSRKKDASDCPYLSNKAVKPGFNDLASKRPDIAAQWHPTKNGDLTPEMVTCGSNKLVVWLLSYDDPLTGKHFDFEWTTKVRERAIQGNGCPYLTGQAIWPGFNDLATTHPLIANQWHPTKNGELKPESFSRFSQKKIWWALPYHDKETGKDFLFEWKATIATRNDDGSDCPVRDNKIICRGYNDLESRCPALAAQWHPVKNGNLTPADVTRSSHTMIWWQLEYDDPFTRQHFIFEWKTSPNSRKEDGSDNPYISGQKVWMGFNDLKTRYPDVAAQWNYEKNGNLKPENMVFGSPKKVWWIMPYDDPLTGNHFDFEWEAQIVSRTTGGNGCPFINGSGVWTGYNDLLSKRPLVAAQWHPTKNGNLTPDRVSYGADTIVWWLLPYDDPATGKHFDFEWKAAINNRNDDGSGCPYLSKNGAAVWCGFNDVATVAPELAKQWHPTKNRLLPHEVSLNSNQYIWWYLPYRDPKTGRYFKFEWKGMVSNRTIDGTDCPFLSNHAVWEGFNDLFTTNPKLAMQWHPTKNRNLNPRDVVKGSQARVWWLLPYDDPISGIHFDFEWRTTISSRNDDGTDCPFLSNHAVWEGFNDLFTTNPKLAMQWHPTKNKNLNPKDVVKGSQARVWWLLPYNDPISGIHFDFEWRTTISSRNDDGTDCPFLSNHAVWEGFNDLASTYPNISAEWHPTKNRKRIPNKVFKGELRKAWWKCSVCGHEWYASVKSRTYDDIGCPECRKKIRYYP